MSFGILMQPYTQWTCNYSVELSLLISIHAYYCIIQGQVIFTSFYTGTKTKIYKIKQENMYISV
jgi:hypothetical protein